MANWWEDIKARKLPADYYQPRAGLGDVETPMSVQKMQTGQYFIPGIGDALDFGEGVSEMKGGNYAMGSALLAAAAVGLVPGVGDVAGKGIKAGAKGILKHGDKAADLLSKANRTMDARRPALGDLAVEHWWKNQDGSVPLFGKGAKPLTPAQQEAQNVLDLLKDGRGAEVTEEMRAAADPQYLYANYDLPVDEASRTARLDKYWPSEGYHSTRADFDAFDKGDVGYHVGTEEQATERLRMTQQWADIPEGENIIPVRYNAGKSLVTNDAGQWNDPRIAGREMERVGLSGAGEIADEGDDLVSQFGNIDDWKASSEAEGLLGELNDTAQSAGYGSIKYANEAENAFGKEPGISREGKRQIEALTKEYHEMRTAAAKRRPDPPDINNLKEGDLQKWMDYDASPSPAEAKRMDEIVAEKAKLTAAHTNDANSYAIFNPANIRSRFAIGDPRLAHLRNLSAGVAGAGAVGLSQQQNEDETLAYLRSVGAL